MYVYGNDGATLTRVILPPDLGGDPGRCRDPCCPIDRIEFLRIVQQVLQGRKPKLPEYPMCVECKFKENGCLNTLVSPASAPSLAPGVTPSAHVWRRLRRLPGMGT